MTRVFIDGAVGTTGLEISARLAGRAEFDLIALDDVSRKDPDARRTALNDADIAILCLPDDAARTAVALIDNPRTRVIDASTAHRTASDWTYGFPEITGRDVVANAARVSNPGCYATGFVALVAPLVSAGLIPDNWPLTANAVSGYSGGGKSMIAEFEDEGASPSAGRTYALTLAHKHVPEMQMHAGLKIAPIFAPSVAPTYRGMIVDVPLHAAALPEAPKPDAIRAVLAAAYDGSPIVRLQEHGDPHLTVEHAAGRDAMDLFVFSNADGGQIRLVAALDNLGKGASGAAVQTLNLMAGLPETTGLRL